MTDRLNQYAELAELLDEVFNSGLDAGRLERLEELLTHDEDARRFYLDYTDLHQDLFKSEGALEASGRRMRRHEPAVAALEQQGALRLRRRILAFGASFAAAAMLIFAILLSIQHTWDQPPDSQVVRFTGGGAVARVVQVEGESGTPAAIQEGFELSAGPLEIGPGLMRLQFFGGASAIVQGPASLELRTSSSLAMKNGRLAVRIDRPTGTFRVESEGVRITDLGTEFGLELDGAGSGHVQVYEGAVQAELLDEQGEPLKSLKLSANQAARFERGRKVLENSDWQADAFARRMPIRPVWLDLADVVSGGDGRGGGNLHGIDPATGRMDASAGQGRIWGNDRYNPVVRSSFIDGTFIPDGSKGPVQIDSAGHRFAFAPTTNGTQDMIRSGGTRDEKKHEANYLPVLDGLNYSQEGRSVIGLHANAGITFDLQSFAASEPDHVPGRFEATAGVIDKGYSGPRADIWVFVDGELRSSKKGVAGDGRGIRLDIVLTAKDRFLTLVSTDAGNGTGHDWVVFGNPRLWLNPKNEKEMP